MTAPSSIRRRAVWVGWVVALLAIALLTVLTTQGVIWPNRLLAARHDVRGLDVSHHNGRIDWDRVAADDVDFVWVKATEGSASTDARFSANWAGARRAGLLTGAYHFMSFESPGASQARNMIDTVPATSGTLAPVVDLEPYGDYKQHMASATKVRAILDPLLAALKAHYGVDPVIYTTSRAYRAYLRGRYRDNPIWFRSVLLPAHLPDGRAWTLWQYSSRDHVEGITGFVDRNVLAGRKRDLEELTQP